MGTTKHLPFQKFQAIHMPLNDAIAPRKRESRPYSGIITANAIGKTLEFGDLAFRCTLKPVRKLLRLTLLEQFNELLSQTIHPMEFLVCPLCLTFFCCRTGGLPRG